MEYPDEVAKVQTVYNGTLSDARLYREVSTLYDNKQRREIEYYPGANNQSFNSTLKVDDWGNLVYTHNDYGFECFYSYENTNTSDKFVYSNGTQVQLFNDSFYDNTISPTIHNMQIGYAQLQNGTGSNKLETYNKYDFSGNLIETKSLLEDNWIKNQYTYDEYGNLVLI